MLHYCVQSITAILSLNIIVSITKQAVIIRHKTTDNIINIVYYIKQKSIEKGKKYESAGKN